MENEDLEVRIMSDIDRVKMWAATMKLNENTAEELIRHGFDTMEAISYIEKDDLPTLRLPLGQQKVLIKAVKKTFGHSETDSVSSEKVVRGGGIILQEKDGGPSGGILSDKHGSANIQDGGVLGNQNGGDTSSVHNNKDGGDTSSVQNNKDGGAHRDDAYVREVLKMLSAQKAGTGISLSDNSFKNTSGTDSLLVNDSLSWKDPQFFFNVGNFDPNVSYFDIVDFVPPIVTGVTAPDQKLVSDASGGQLVYKSGPSKPKLESLSVTQWSMANLCIMQKLLFTGDLTQSQIIDYLSYTQRVYHQFWSCELVSVLLFDREYRRLQKQHQFRWGTEVHHLHSACLRPKFLQSQNSRHVVPAQGSKLTGTKSNFVPYASHTSVGKLICKKFNSRKGCLMPHCKFEHVCALPGCADKHPAFQHTKN